MRNNNAFISLAATRVPNLSLNIDIVFYFSVENTDAFGLELYADGRSLPSEDPSVVPLENVALAHVDVAAQNNYTYLLSSKSTHFCNKSNPPLP